MIKRKIFTSESVTEGHPDKICDRISDSILDALLKQDENSRCACETIATTGLISVMGEMTSKAVIDIQKIVRAAVADIGYTDSSMGFDAETCAVINMLHAQSPDIALGVDRSLEAKAGEFDDGYDTGAGDQGMMFGYACDETPELMPMPISLAHKLARRLTEVRKNGMLPYLRPDGKTQVSVEYEDDRPVRVATVVVSSQHAKEAELDKIREDIIKNVVDPIIPSDFRDSHMKIFVNPTGRFTIGGPMGDSGLSGRKIIVDTYGGYSRHGGGSFSGKDATKVDRTGAYACRYLAKNIVAAGLASRCELQIAYAIGVARPVSVMVDTFGTGKVDDAKIEKAVVRSFDLRPAAIIEAFGLRRPIFSPLSAYGHMGREELCVGWEKTDLVEKLLTNI